MNISVDYFGKCSTLRIFFENIQEWKASDIVHYGMYMYSVWGRKSGIHIAMSM